MGFGTMNNYMQYWFVWAAHHSQISSSRANEQIIDLVSAHQKPGLPPTACHGVTSAPSFWTCHDTCNCGAVPSAPRWTQTSGAVRPWASDVRRAWLVFGRWGALLRCRSVSVSACEFETRQIPIKKVWTLPMIGHKAETLWITMQHHNADKVTSTLSCLRVAFNNIMPMHMCLRTLNHHSIASCLCFL